MARLLPQFLVSRLPGVAAIAGCLLTQSAYEHLFCGGGYIGLWPVTLLLLLPAFAFLVTSDPAPAVAAAGVTLLFSLWANRVECAPYVGGGAAMGYVPAFLIGLPASVVVGLLAGLFWAKASSATSSHSTQ